MPQNNACTCNLVAYNLQAGCGWCQSSIQDNWWLDEAQWAGNCTTSAFDSTGIPSSASTTSINIPSWALLTNTGPSWNPAQASAAVVVTGGVNTNFGAATTAPTVTGGYSYGYTPDTNTIGYIPNSLDPYYTAGIAAYIIVLGTSGSSVIKRTVSLIDLFPSGVMFGLYALLSITIVVIYFVRQNHKHHIT
jgi:hypothetical protein